MDDATSVPTDDALANTANRLPEMKKHLLILAMLPIMSYIQSNYMSNYQVTDTPNDRHNNQNKPCSSLATSLDIIARTAGIVIPLNMPDEIA